MTTHVDYNQLDFYYHLKSYTPILWIYGCTGTLLRDFKITNVGENEFKW